MARSAAARRGLVRSRRLDGRSSGFGTERRKSPRIDAKPCLAGLGNRDDEMVAVDVTAVATKATARLRGENVTRWRSGFPKCAVLPSLLRHPMSSSLSSSGEWGWLPADWSARTPNAAGELRSRQVEMLVAVRVKGDQLKRPGQLGKLSSRTGERERGSQAEGTVKEGKKCQTRRGRCSKVEKQVCR